MKKEIYDSEEHRPDQTPLLGEELTPLEKKYYKVIVSNRGLPVSPKEIYRQVYGDDFDSCGESNEEMIQVGIVRLRKKLGEEEIITRNGLGYISRRALISRMFGRNKENGKD